MEMIEENKILDNVHLRKQLEDARKEIRLLNSEIRILLLVIKKQRTHEK